MTRANFLVRFFRLSPVALLHDKSLSIWRKAHQKQEMIKWTISGGHQVPLLWGPQIRPPALPLENRHRTQRKLLSAALPHLPGLSRSDSLSPQLSISLFLSRARSYSLCLRDETQAFPSTTCHRTPPGYHRPSLIRLLQHVTLTLFFFLFCVASGYGD